MTPKFNLWLEADDQVVLSLWRVRLLQAVAEAGSITQGAENMGVPYRVAWQKIHEMETQLSEKLLETQTGGNGGGGAVLTAAGAAHIARFEAFTAAVAPLIAAQYARIFAADEAVEMV